VIPVAEEEGDFSNASSELSRLRPHRLGPWRQLFQWGCTLTLMAIPFVRVDGGSLLRLDLPTLSLQAFGHTFRIEELYLFLLFVIALVLVFLLVTLALGRAWCGWACPQTTLADLAEGFARLIGVRVTAGQFEGNGWQTALLQVFYLALALLFAANLVWYFVSPYDFFARLLAADLGGGILLTLAVTAGIVWFDLAFVRRLLCREFCPYGRFQSVLVDPGTLTLRFHPDEADRCIRCDACVRACPTGIDIRRGFQIECINCGRCLDACRETMARRGQPGIIRYTFGLDGRGLKALFNLRMGMVLVALAGVTTALVLSAVHLPEASLKLSRTAAAPRLLEDGRLVNFFTAYVTNRAAGDRGFTLNAHLADGSPLEIRGSATDLQLAGGERRRLDFALVAPAGTRRESAQATFVLRDSQGRVTARAEALITAPQE
jgi:cytochrome c oxidase accessory protein FixG